MPDSCFNRLFVVGTREAVSEVAMFVAQDVALEVRHVDDTRSSSAVRAEVGFDGFLRASWFSEEPITAWPTPGEEGYNAGPCGIRMVPQLGEPSPLVEFEIEYETSSQPCEMLSKKFSERFPDVVIGNLFRERYADLWGMTAYQQGVGIFDRRPAHIPVPAELKARYRRASDEDAGEVDDEVRDHRDGVALLEFSKLAAQRIAKRQQMRAAEIPKSLTSHGWPRWSLLAHMANAGGPGSLARHVTALGDDVGDALEREVAAARELRVASWIDCALYGCGAEAPLQEQWDATPPYLSLNVYSADFESRHLAMLELLADDGPAGKALLRCLSIPESRLMSGLHPVVSLTKAAGAAARISDAARNGLERLHAALAAQVQPLRDLALLNTTGGRARRKLVKTPADELVRSTLALVALPRVTESQLKPARALGVPADFLTRTLIGCASAWQPWHVRDVGPDAVLPALKDTFGRVSLIPTGAQHEIGCYGFRAAYDAMLTAEAMDDKISARTSEACEAAPRRPRRPGL